MSHRCCQGHPDVTSPWLSPLWPGPATKAAATKAAAARAAVSQDRDDLIGQRDNARVYTASTLGERRAPQRSAPAMPATTAGAGYACSGTSSLAGLLSSNHQNR